MRKMFLLIFLISSVVYSQLLEENFDYGSTAGLLTNITSNWTRHSGTSDDFNYITTSLSYTNYPTSGIGGSVSILSANNDDVNRIFTSQNSGSVYYSALINASSVSTTGGDYNIHFGTTGTHYARLYFKKGSVSGKFVFGITKVNETPSYISTEYNTNTTYLIVLKYTFNTGTNQDDEVKLWINPDLSGSEPSADLTHTATTTDASSFSAISLRQNSSSINIDGIRVATSWSQAPLPVELVSFNGIVKDNFQVQLDWATATEVNNYGFNVERRTGNESWKNIAFVQGNGNSNSPKEYTYTDQPNGGKEFSYRLKQIDFDGSYEYSGEITVTLEEIKEYKLYQNYPNPFNPETIISYSLPTQSYVRLKVYDMLGKEITTLIDKQQEAGNYITTFNTQDYLLSSGVYYIVLQSGNFTETKKCILIK